MQGTNTPPTPKSDKQLVSASGEVLSSDHQTGRAVERSQENSEFVSVIVKRTDETFRHPDDILEKAIHEGKEQHERPAFSLFLSAVAAGMILCFTVLAVAVTASVLGSESKGFERVILATVYPLGFVLCILSRTQLFTEHTATAVYPVLDRKAQIRSLLRLWGIVIAGNMVGGLLGAAMLVMAEPVIVAHVGYVQLAEHIMHYPADVLFISAVLAGWLMALGAWIVLATHSTISQILSIYIVTFVIGLGGLHHSIAGSVELFAAALVGDAIDFGHLPFTILTMLAGNLVGGSVFVAVLNYGHIRHSQRVEKTPANAKKSG
ncbi:formate/nitrite transporter family protein [Aestuariibacter halophilus]|uniref:Formate/nitrite transporter family protein n=1 Tax=Fluctibacter halophilus TaxID=226011 RepID=A0ABS8GCV0_9ALTE|nr:formate/nitrite transporter family protein [Aestuariibacter halophilus]MCC2617026.1 formate/nitrite transporter family protein [Aestuariibacter halophilus]